jgi:NAD(P)-dependent dehydrogenase (short-subunit alcohol dehydrogenase family)
MPATREAVIVGASGGIGRAIADRLEARPDISRVHRLARRTGEIDIADEASIAAAAEVVGREARSPVGLVFVATGLLHAADDVKPEKDWRSLDPVALARCFAVNAIGPALVAKHFLPLLPRDERSVFAALSARVGSIGDNNLGGWYGYRASKAALNQFIRTFSVELARKRPRAICAALHPGTVATDLSRPFSGNVSPERLFTPAQSADHLLRVMDGLDVADSGGFFAWDGARIEY